MVQEQQEGAESAKASKPWWQGLPAIITALATLVVAITGLLTALSPGPGGPVEQAGAVQGAAPTATGADHSARLDVTGAWLSPAFTAVADKHIYLQQQGAVVSGFYNDKQNGRIVRGRLEGPRLSAYWVEDMSDLRCERPLEGSYHWGRVYLTFSADGQRFEGNWGYCDGKPHRDFLGQRKAAEG